MNNYGPGPEAERVSLMRAPDRRYSLKRTIYFVANQTSSHV